MPPSPGLLLLLAVALVVVVALAVARRRRTRAHTPPTAPPSPPDAARQRARGPLWIPSVLETEGLEALEQGLAADDAAPEVRLPAEPSYAPEARPPAELPYTRRRYLLTQAEREFFAVLCAAAPEGWHVFPQVRLANLVMLKQGTRNWKPHFSRVAQKCVDFVLCDAHDIGPRLVVELDDSSHDRPDREARDRFVDAALRAAGLPILHVRWQRRYDPGALADQIRAAAGLSPVPRGASARAPGAHARSAAPIPATGAPVSPSAAAAGTTQRRACRSCRAEVSETARYCKACGAPVER